MERKKFGELLSNYASRLESLMDDVKFHISLLSTETSSPPAKNDPSQEKMLLRVSEVSKLLSIPKSTLYEMVRDGRIAHVRNGTSIYIPRTEVDQFVAQRSCTGVIGT